MFNRQIAPLYRVALLLLCKNDPIAWAVKDDSFLYAFRRVLHQFILPQFHCVMILRSSLIFNKQSTHTTRSFWSLLEEVTSQPQVFLLSLAPHHHTFSPHRLVKAKGVMSLPQVVCFRARLFVGWFTMRVGRGWTLPSNLARQNVFSSKYNAFPKMNTSNE